MSAAELMQNLIVPRPGEDVVARAVVLILHTIGAPSQGIEARGWCIAPSIDVLDDHALVQRLSHMPKPVVCEPIPADAPRTIQCGHPDENPRWTWLAQGQLDAGSVLGTKQREEIERTGNTRILLVGEGESIVLSVAEVEQLNRDYVIPGTYTIAQFRASRLDPTLDVALVWRYWRSTATTQVMPFSE